MCGTQQHAVTDGGWRPLPHCSLVGCCIAVAALHLVPYKEDDRACKIGREGLTPSPRHTPSQHRPPPSLPPTPAPFLFSSARPLACCACNPAGVLNGGSPLNGHKFAAASLHRRIVQPCTANTLEVAGLSHALLTPTSTRAPSNTE